MPSSLELAFETYWIQCGGDFDILTPEHKFHPTRKWRFDFVHLPSKIGIEVEGGTWMKKGGHTTGVGYRNNCIKYNAATLMGWRVFRYTTDMLKDDAYGHLKPIIEEIEKCRNNL